MTLEELELQRYPKVPESAALAMKHLMIVLGCTAVLSGCATFSTLMDPPASASDRKVIRCSATGVDPIGIIAAYHARERCVEDLKSLGYTERVSPTGDTRPAGGDGPERQ